MKNKKKKYGFRKLLNDLHLWLGLGSGIILFLVCLSGTVLTFEKEIKSFFAKDFQVSGTKVMKIETLAEALQKEGEVSSVSIPAEAGKAYEFRVKTSPEDRRGTTFYVDPYTGEYLQSKKSSLDGFFMWNFRMHRWLLLDSAIGRPIVGIATIIFLFLALSGVVLWFPKKLKWKNMKSGFKIKTSANWKRINHDLHNTLGFYACIFLVIMTLTGLFWSFEWYREAGSSVLGTKVFNRGGAPSFISNDNIGAGDEASLASICSISSEELNYDGTTTISFPSGEDGVYNIRKTNDNGWSPVTTDQLVLDRDGTVLNKEIFSEKPLNVQIASLIKPIHTGEIFGTFSKIIYFLACLIATSLPITGTLIWLNKMKKKKPKNRNKKQEPGVKTVF
ncbi:PepSY-associated TM helix domain-containing protein [Salinimicrobium terrae]|uniref:PepSY-associated TM helix domain-containing protein n=1 Tax=Salinimicrobium terrae TaxID=470866 RepID=UPI000414FA03|nr:PepSY-associated TM helix domain-containing protein [Salinimicrobium terrae]